MKTRYLSKRLTEEHYNQLTQTAAEMGYDSLVDAMGAWLDNNLNKATLKGVETLIEEHRREQDRRIEAEATITAWGKINGAQRKAIKRLIISLMVVTTALVLSIVYHMLNSSEGWSTTQPQPMKRVHVLTDGYQE